MSLKASTLDMFLCVNELQSDLALRGAEIIQVVLDVRGVSL